MLLRSPAFRSLVRSPHRLKKERNRLLRRLRKKLIKNEEKYQSILFTKCVLQSVDLEERLAVTKLLGQMFSEKDSELATQNKPLWNSYLGRYM